MVQTFNIDQLVTEIDTTSNKISTRITDLYTKDITFEENVTVSGNLTVDGSTVTINTDAYTTEVLEIANDSDNTVPLLKIDNNSDSDRNIIELSTQGTNVFSVDNSGTLEANGGKFTSSLTFEKDAPYFHIKDTAASGGTASHASLHVNSENFFILGPGTAICQTTNLIDKTTTFGSNVTVNGRAIVSYSPYDGTKTGIDLYGGNSKWGIYVASGKNDTANTLSMSGNVACKGYNFDHQSIRLRTVEDTGYGLIYETVNTSTNDEECKFSVRASDGFGYFKGSLQVDNNLTVAGSTFIKATTIDVGRGNVLIENNSNDNDDGAGITIRTATNPSTGSIFSVRSAGNGNRLWVGQNITTTGINDFGVGHTGSTGGESDLSGYKFQVDAGTGNVTTEGNITATGTIDVRQDLSNDDDFLPEQRYPPKEMTGLTHNFLGETYGNGLYEVSSSSSATGVADIYNAFYGTYASQEGAYSSSDGVYQLANYIVPGYLGEWIKLKLPFPIKLTKYGFTNLITASSDLSYRSPGQYKIYGSNDGVNWTVLVHKTSTITYTANVFEESITTNGTYKYFALVVNKVLGPVGGRLHFKKFAIYGQEVNKKFSVDALDGSGHFAGDLQVNRNLTVAGRTTVPWSPNDGTKTGIDLYGGDSNWGIYVATGTSATSMSGNTACKGHNFDYQSIRLRTAEDVGYGLIYETVDTATNVEECKFSVRASDGSGYFAGDLQVGGDITTSGDLTVDNNLKIDYNNGGNGIRFYNSDWGIYMANPSGTSFGGGTPCSGYLFNDAAIRIRTSTTSDGFIYENKNDQCNFSVRGSDGLGYFRGGLVIAKDASNADDFFPGEISHNTGGTHIGGYSGGNYTGSDYIEPGYLGVVVRTTAPNQMKLTKYNFTQRQDYYGTIRAPAKYRIYGSNDNTKWTLLFDKTATPSYVNYFFEESVTTTGVYKYFALVVNTVTGESLVNYESWVLFGQEVNKKFSVDASDGSGYFAGSLQVGGDLTTTGNVNGATPTEISQLSGIGSNTIKDQLDAKQGVLSDTTDVIVKDLTVGGNLTVNGSTVTINTDAYTTEILHIVNDSPYDTSLLKIDNDSGSDRNIIELSTHGTNVFSVDNSGTLEANGGKFTSSLTFEKDAPYFDIKDTATSGGTASHASLHVNTQNFYIIGPGNTICQTTNLINKSTIFGSNITVGGRATVPYSPFDGTKTGIDLYGGDSKWGIYVASGTNAISMSGNAACKGHNFDYQSIRLRTVEAIGYGLIYETVNTTTNVEECKFSVRASDGSGYFAGDLQVDGNITVTGTINGGSGGGGGGGGGGKVFIRPSITTSRNPVSTFSNQDLSNVSMFYYNSFQNAIMFKIYAGNRNDGFIAEGCVRFNNVGIYVGKEIFYQSASDTKTDNFRIETITPANLSFDGSISSFNMTYTDTRREEIKISKIIFF